MVIQGITFNGQPMQYVAVSGAEFCQKGIGASVINLDQMVVVPGLVAGVEIGMNRIGIVRARTTNRKVARDCIFHPLSISGTHVKYRIHERRLNVGVKIKGDCKVGMETVAVVILIKGDGDIVEPQHWPVVQSGPVSIVQTSFLWDPVFAVKML